MAEYIGLSKTSICSSMRCQEYPQFPSHDNVRKSHFLDLSTTNLMNTSLIIPIKQLSNAKQRLSAVLTPEERSLLFKAMVQDVLEVATTCDRIDDVYIVTSDSEVSELAHQYSAKVMAEVNNPESKENGLVQAVTFMSEHLAKEGVEIMMFLPGDIPLVSVEELEVVLDGFGLSGEAEMMIVPAEDLGGSNCMVCSPPNCMRFGFGEDSFRRHLRFAKEKEIEPSVAKLPGIGLDIDTPDDLQKLSQFYKDKGLESHTSRFLESSGILEKLNIDEKHEIAAT